MQRILEARAAALARVPQDDTGPAATALLVLAVGEARIALPADRVREVLSPGPLAQIPSGRGPAGGALVGMRSVRGEIIAVADAARLLSLSTTTATESRLLAVVDDSDGSRTAPQGDFRPSPESAGQAAAPVSPLGLLVDAAIGLREIHVGPTRAAGSEAPHGIVSAVTSDGVLVLDAEAILRDPRASTTTPPAPETAP